MSEMTVEKALDISDRWDDIFGREKPSAVQVLAAEVRRLRKAVQAEVDYSQELVDKYSRTDMAILAAEVRRLREENFALAAGACPVNGGLVGDEGGTPYCAKEREIAELKAIISGALVEDVIQYFPAEWIARAEKALGGKE